MNKGFTNQEYEATAELGLEGPSDLAYAFTSQAEAVEAGLGGLWQVARLCTHAYAYTAGRQLFMWARRRIRAPFLVFGMPLDAVGCSPSVGRAAGGSRSQVPGAVGCSPRVQLDAHPACSRMLRRRPTHTTHQTTRVSPV